MACPAVLFFTSGAFCKTGTAYNMKFIITYIRVSPGIKT
jgi:hypothetical protein